MTWIPTHCAWCGALLMGGATQHAPSCWIGHIGEVSALADAIAARVREKFETGEWRFADQCECRTCGHVASSHIGGHCFECGRENCWR